MNTVYWLRHLPILLTNLPLSLPATCYDCILELNRDSLLFDFISVGTFAYSYPHIEECCVLQDMPSTSEMNSVK